MDVDDHIELLQQVFDEAAKIIIANVPILKQVTTDFINLVFCPKIIAKQLVLAIAIDAGMVSLNQVSRIVHLLLSNFSSRKRLIRQLEMEQNCASTQDEWMELAERIDNIQENDIWRSDPNCPLYERDRISARIDEFVHLMRRRDVFELMFELRGGIGRNKFGLLHEGLFSKAMAGSKVLVETYHNVVCATLDFVCDSPVLQDEDPIPTDARLAFFNEMRHSYGRTALLLSGGAALGHYHVGVVKTLINNNLMPRVIGGASAGSILCSMVATRTNDEILNDLLNVKPTTAPGHSGKLRLDFFRPLINDRHNDNIISTGDSQRHLQGAAQQQPAYKTALGRVYNNTAGAFHDAKRTWQVFAPIGLRRFTSIVYDIFTGNCRASELLMNDTNHFREVVKMNVGNFTFQEAFDRTGRILNIVVTPQNATDPPRLLNYLTAPHVLVWSAAVASSSLPGVFEANRLMVKDADGTERYECAAGQKFSDGSMEQDLPMQQLSEMFNVNHFIISQANPHAVMFGSYNQQKSVWTNPITGMIDAILLFLKNQLRNWFQDVVELIGTRRITPLFETRRGFGTHLITQEYEGRDCDISLIPWINHRSVYDALLHVLYNPSNEEFQEWVEAAERETWKYIPAIKSHIAEEITLDLCVQRLRKRLLAERWKASRIGNRSRSSAENSRENGSKPMIGERVPSFFTSPSLVNLGGMCIGDQASIESLHTAATLGDSNHYQEQTTAEKLPHHSLPANTFPVEYAPSSVSPQPIHQQLRDHQSQGQDCPKDIKSGWGGLGLRGNRSSGSLSRTTSAGSGLFIEEEEQQLHRYMPAGEHTSNIVTQTASSYAANPTTATVTDLSYLHSYYGIQHNEGAATSGPCKPDVGHVRSDHVRDKPPEDVYVKTTCMANFYYRKDSYSKNSRSYDDMKRMNAKIARKAAAKDNNNNSTATSGKSYDDNNGVRRGRRKSKSQSDLEAVLSSLTTSNDGSKKRPLFAE